MLSRRFDSTQFRYLFIAIATSENLTEAIVVELGGVCTAGRLEFVSTVKTLANVSANKLATN